MFVFFCVDERNNLESKLHSLLSWVANLEQLCLMDLRDESAGTLMPSAVGHLSRPPLASRPNGPALRSRRPASLESAHRSLSAGRSASPPARSDAHAGLSSSRLQAELDSARRTLSRVSALLLESERTQDVAASANRALAQDLEAARRRVSLLECRLDRDRPDSALALPFASSAPDSRHHPAPNSERIRLSSTAEKSQHDNLLLSDKCNALERQTQALQKEILEANVRIAYLQILL